MRIRPVILSGGSGTRLWPASRARHPKQFSPLSGNKFLFEETLDTVSDDALFSPPIIVGNVEHKFMILESLEKEGVKNALVLLEPFGRNTGAAALVAALAEKSEDAFHLVLPSDHVIKDKGAFYACVRKALAQNEVKGRFVLFGIAPDRAETGFGYIVPDKAPLGDGLFPVERFEEKPPEARAQELISSGALWNSGIFLFAPKTLLAEAAHLAPSHMELCREAVKSATLNLGCLHLGEAPYQALQSVPFDRLIMEKTILGAVVPCAMGWSDVGSWQAMWQLAEKDGGDNALFGETAVKDTHHCYVRSYGPLIALIGGENLAVVATKDAVLVAPLARAQEVKDIVGQIERSGGQKVLEHPKVMRPWGSYENVAAGPRFQVKHILVAPGKSLSLQRHEHRAEHWVVVAGTAKVECDGTEKQVAPNESVFVPKGAVHRLSNPGKEILQVIEVQSGDYLGEDDIVRLSDEFGR